MKLLLDAQLPPSLCGWFVERGHDCAHVLSLGLVAADDREIAVQAEFDGWCVLSKDEDFLRLRSPDRFQLVWLRCGNITNRALRAWLELRWPLIERMLMEGEGLIEVI